MKQSAHAGPYAGVSGTHIPGLMLCVSVIEVDPVIASPEPVGQRVGNRHAPVLPAGASDPDDQLIFALFDVSGDKK